MNCLYCQNPLQDNPPASVDHFKASCWLCQTSFYYSLPEEELLWCEMKVKYKEHWYTAMFTFDAYIQKYFLGKSKTKFYTEPFILLNAGKRLLTFNYHPNITPANFLQKLPTLLTFS
jgi:hypothetical protein